MSVIGILIRFSGFDLWNCRPFTTPVHLYTGNHQLHMLGFVISMPYILNHYIHLHQVSIADKLFTSITILCIGKFTGSYVTTTMVRF